MLLLVLCSPWGIARAASFQVTAGDTSGLIAAITAANDEVGYPGKDTITLAGGVYTLTNSHPQGGADGPTGLPSITSEIEIVGNGATIQRDYDSGNIFRIFHVAAGGNLTLSNLTVQNGYTGNESDTPPIDPTPGGGILNHGTLVIERSTIFHNGYRDNLLVNPDNPPALHAVDQTGVGGGIYNTGSLVMTNSRVLANTTDWNGHYGGGIFNGGNAVLINCTVQGNRAAAGGGIYNEAGSSLQIIRTSLRSNITRFYGGALYNDGGALLSNSTVSKTNDSVHNLGVLTIENSTVTGGIRWRVVGGIYNVSPGIVSLKNSVVAGNEGDCAGLMNSLGYNLDSDGTCGLSAVGDLPSTVARLGPYQDNGGPTWTHALLPGSPAIDRGDPNACLATDQRGVLRPIDGNLDHQPRCDIGAYEFEPLHLFLPLVQR